MIPHIVETAKNLGKNILIIGSARSGTHPMASELAMIDESMTSLYEICGDDMSDIDSMYRHDNTYLAQIVSYTAKIKLAHDVAKLKEHMIIVNIKRHDKIKQFASWMCFKHGGARYNVDHFTKGIPPGSLTATHTDIEQFITEQIVDEFFLPDFIVEYEKIHFTTTTFRKNQYAYPIEEIFINLDYVKSRLSDWKYAPGHLDG